LKCCADDAHNTEDEGVDPAAGALKRVSGADGDGENASWDVEGEFDGRENVLIVHI
jgi:hypothetical protein